MNDNSPPPSKQGESRSKDEQWIKGAVQHHLNHETDQLDFNITSKLAAARHRAMDQNKPATPSSDWLNWPALAGGTAMLLIALVVGRQFYSPAADNVPDVITIAENTSTSTSNLIEDLPLLSATDDIEFYQSIEFLEWMESNSG